MKKILIALAAVGLAAGASAADEKAAVMTAVSGFVAAFNKGDVKAAAATCAEQTSIIDEFPPYEWHGAGSCARWMADYDTDAKKNVITDGLVTLGTPKHTDVAGDRAYVVAPADYAFKKAGKPVKETASMLTIALQKSPSGWRIVGWSWSKN
jgi:ketosteroid isomerase-like protein